MIDDLLRGEQQSRALPAFELLNTRFLQSFDQVLNDLLRARIAFEEARPGRLIAHLDGFLLE